MRGRIGAVILQVTAVCIAAWIAASVFHLMAPEVAFSHDDKALALGLACVVGFLALLPALLRRARAASFSEHR